MNREGSSFRTWPRWGCFLVGVLVAAPGFAQTGSGEIAGRVWDQTSAVISGVTLRVVNEASGLGLATVSNEAGLYRVPALLAGSYRVEAGKEGFQGSVRRGVVIAADQQLALDLTLAANAATTPTPATAPSSAAAGMPAASPAAAQTAQNPAPAAALAAQSDGTGSQSLLPAAEPSARARAFVKRWIDLQNASLNLRYRYVDSSAGVVTTNQLQHRETLRFRLKFDDPGRYALNFGLFTGVRFTSGWDNTPLGIGPAQRNLAFKALYFAAQPVVGVEVQIGGLYIVKGESTEFTTYDEDGYIMGERLTVRRPKQLFFDEVSVTNAYFVSDPTMIPVSRRFRHIDEPNYQHYLVGKKIGQRAGVSADYTVVSGVKTWRQAINVKLPELRVVDSIIFEQYERTNADRAYGFAISLSKQLTKRLSLNQFGYARIDPKYGSLNADRLNIGNRAFVMATYVFSPEFTASFFITTAVGQNGVLPQRTLSNTVFTYNVLPALKRAGLF